MFSRTTKFSPLRNLIPYLFTGILLAGFASGVTISHKAAASVSLNSFFLVKPPCDPLQPTIIDSVSADPATGIITVSWIPNFSLETDYYVVYIYNSATNPPWNPVANVPGAGSTSTTINGYNASDGLYIFAVSAFDTCGEQSYFYPKPEDNHNTIFLEADYNSCELEVNLRWNKYNNWQNGISKYEIWSCVNSGSYSLVGVTEAADTTFIHSGVASEANVCYFVRAFENNSNKTSASNNVCVFTDYPDAPAFSYIQYVTVNGASSVKVVAYIDDSADVLKYIIERKAMNTFDSIAEVWPDELTGQQLTYTDTNVNTGKENYVYRIITVNNCGKESNISNEGKTILLNVENNSNAMINQLIWNDYIEWDNEVESYNIYRGLQGGYTKIANIPFGFNSYEDNIAEYYTGEGEFCYYIEAIEGPGNSFGFMEMSNSNIRCTEQKPFLYVPSAFTPGGINPIFQPVFAYIEPDSYKFSIYSRWGEKFFETTDTEIGWDGNTSAGPAPSGSYVFHIEYKAAYGQSFLKTGTVSLLR